MRLKKKNFSIIEIVLLFFVIGKIKFLTYHFLNNSWNFLKLELQCANIVSNIFTKIHNQELDSTHVSNPIRSISTGSLIECFCVCLLNHNCTLVSYHSTDCKFYNTLDFQYLIPSAKSNFYKIESEFNRSSSIAITIISTPPPALISTHFTISPLSVSSELTKTFSSAESTSTILATTISTEAVTSSTTTIITNVCINGNGRYPDLATGGKFYWDCVFFGTQFQQIYYRPCALGTLFDPIIQNCIWKKFYFFYLFD